MLMVVCVANEHDIHSTPQCLTHDGDSITCSGCSPFTGYDVELDLLLLGLRRGQYEQ